MNQTVFEYSVDKLCNKDRKLKINNLRKYLHLEVKDRQLFVETSEDADPTIIPLEFDWEDCYAKLKVSDVPCQLEDMDDDILEYELGKFQPKKKDQIKNRQINIQSVGHLEKSESDVKQSKSKRKTISIDIKPGCSSQSIVITPKTATQQSVFEIMIFSGNHEVLLQNYQASRSQLVTSVSNAQLIAKEAVELLAEQSAEQILFQMNVTTQAQLEEFIIISLLAADLRHRLATPILETDLPVSAKNIVQIILTKYDKYFNIEISK
ncbi:MAG: hypothetical protein EZS28_015869 [Streblomastix strix]|uniref:Uncharacterized protein n=1 Tax=Streblomastix strix TaxID=222440 RepID=A0A5J4W2B1_9EUKA|nr:MAG: hypothetical protein EZS28_015869 [Streblomastix strix]